MERQVWRSIVAALNHVDKPRENARVRFRCLRIVEVLLWAVLHDRPISWAVQRENWPPELQRHLLPSNSTMSRRLRSKNVQCVLKQLEQMTLICSQEPSLVAMIDGKPLVIGGCSKDRQAGYGRAAASMAKGYKMHALIDNNGSLLDWRLAPMNRDEGTMARRLLRDTSFQGYVVADGNYDSTALHLQCSERGDIQLVAPRSKKDRGKGLGHRKQAPSRLRSIEILEGPDSRFGKQLHRQREEIERYFAGLTNWGGGLTHLPAWARTHHRVHRWVQGKLVINALKKRTYVN